MTRKKGAIFLFFAAAFIGGGVALFGGEHHYEDAAAPAAQQNGLAFYNPRIYAVLPGATTTAGYAKIFNNGGGDKMLLSVSANFAGKAEIHETTDADGISKMRHLADGLRVAAGERVELVPGGMHLMFSELSASKPVGDAEPVVLFFSGGLEITVNFLVAKRGEGDAHENH